MTEMKIIQMNDCDWFIGESLESCVAEALKNFYDGDSIYVEDARELTDGELDTMKFSRWSDDGLDETTRTFRKQLAIEIAKGGEFPRLFASTEY